MYVIICKYEHTKLFMYIVLYNIQYIKIIQIIDNMPKCIVTYSLGEPITKS